MDGAAGALDGAAGAALAGAAVPGLLAAAVGLALVVELHALRAAAVTAAAAAALAIVRLRFIGLSPCSVGARIHSYWLFDRQIDPAETGMAYHCERVKRLACEV
jgi:hypothetical protein